MAREKQVKREGGKQQKANWTGRQEGLTWREPRAASAYSTPYFANPFGLVRRFGEEIDRIFEDFGFGRSQGGSSLAPGSWTQTIWSPQVEIFQRDDQLVVRADLPGLTRDDVNVELRDNSLIIEGERKSEDEERQEGFYRSERSYGRFRRTIPLPEDADFESADAAFNNGVLEVKMSLPQRKSVTKQLKIRESAEEKPKARAQAAGKAA